MGVWSSGALGNKPLCRGITLRHAKAVQEMFIENGWMKLDEPDEGDRSQRIHWTENPGQQEFDKLVQVFADLENSQNTSTLLHFDNHVNLWAKKSKTPEFAEKWLNHRLQKPVATAFRLSLILGYLNSFTELGPSKTHEKRILHYMKEIENDLKYVDSRTFAMVIEPLCMTRKYKECLAMVKRYNQNLDNVPGVVPVPIPVYLHYFVNAAIVYGDIQFARKLINQYCDSIDMYHLQKLWACLLKHSDTLPVETSLQLLSTVQHLYPSPSVIETMEQILRQ
jgi:hypothetical protein